MATIGNMPAADLDVTFPSGETRTVNITRPLIRVETPQTRRIKTMTKTTTRTFTELTAHVLGWIL